MIVFTKILPLKDHLLKLRNQGLSLGFAPTMGALHQGHISLIEKSNAQCDITISSIFVNPTQFNESKDLKNYPVTTETDLDLLLRNDCDIVFLPNVEEIYPEGKAYTMPYDLGSLVKVMEGASRSGHFDGVVQVVDRLIQIVEPDKIFMGQKDFQQFSIIQRMLELKKSSVELVVCPIIRGEDGLALSSRNVRLSPEDRILALKLNQALHHIQSNYKNGKIEKLLQEGKDLLKHEKIKLEYLQIVDRKTLLPLKSTQNSGVALVAARVGNVRLIDNMLLE